MKDIIIIGVGKAALLHYNSYNKLKNRGNIYFVDIKKSSKYMKNIEIYDSIKECININNLNKDNLIVDICTPKGEFLNILNVCLEENINNILIEKPFIIDEKQYKKFKNLNIVMVENYLYSKITKWIKKYLEESNKEISLIFTNFSKNRIPDSATGRGYRHEVTLNYEIEIPHQIYLTQYFLNSPNDIKNSITCSRDMKIGDMDLKNHGYGLIVSKYNDADIIYESNLTSIISQKRIIICTKDNYAIEGNYALYSENLSLLRKGNVNVYKDGKLIKNVVFPIDDNFAYFIKASYDYFNGKTTLNPNLVSILNFSKNMKLYCDNLIVRKEKNKKTTKK